MTNIAYRRYLDDALSRSNLSDDERGGAEAFLAFLDTYDPTAPAKAIQPAFKGLEGEPDKPLAEPGSFDYAGANGDYIVSMMDSSVLPSYGIDPDKLGEDGASELLAVWTALVHDDLGADWCDILPDALDDAMRRLGFDPDARWASLAPDEGGAS